MPQEGTNEDRDSRQRDEATLLLNLPHPISLRVPSGPWGLAGRGLLLDRAAAACLRASVSPPSPSGNPVASEGRVRQDGAVPQRRAAVPVTH